MRALYVNHTARISGGEHSLIALLEALPPDVEPTVACPEGALAHRLRRSEIEVVPITGTDGSLRLDPIGTPRAMLQITRAARQVRSVASALGADLIHANSIRAGIIAAAGRPGHRPTVVHVRDCLPPGRLSSLSLRAIGRADALIANSDYTGKSLGRATPEARVVHNAVDVKRFRAARLSQNEARVRLGLSRQRPVLGVIAQITPWKAQDDAVKILAALIDEYPDVQLLLVGAPKFTSSSTRYDNTAFFESLRRMVRDLGVAQAVHFLGEREDVPEIMRALDLLLVPSWEEPFGRTIIEAMASGIPVAATNVGGPPEVIGKADCGLLLPPRVPQLWATEIAALLREPGRLAAMGVRGRATAERRFCMERHVAQVLAVYGEVLGTAAAPSG